MVNLLYRDTEGLLVEVYDGPAPGYEMDVFRIADASNSEMLAHIRFQSLERAQAFARLLVGIEIQPDGAAWQRGPRPPARPTDAQDNIIEEPEGR